MYGRRKKTGGDAPVNELQNRKGGGGGGSVFSGQVEKRKGVESHAESRTSRGKDQGD